MKFTPFDKVMFSVTSLLCCILIFTACSILEKRLELDVKVNEYSHNLSSGKVPFVSSIIIGVTQ